MTAKERDEAQNPTNELIGEEKVILLRDFDEAVAEAELLMLVRKVNEAVAQMEEDQTVSQEVMQLEFSV
jgi:hypothetical protein